MHKWNLMKFTRLVNVSVLGYWISADVFVWNQQRCHKTKCVRNIQRNHNKIHVTIWIRIGNIEMLRILYAYRLCSFDFCYVTGCSFWFLPCNKMTILFSALQENARFWFLLCRKMLVSIFCRATYEFFETPFH